MIPSKRVQVPNGIHNNWSDLNQWRGDCGNETPDEKLSRWAEENSDVDLKLLNRVFIQEKMGEISVAAHKGYADKERVPGSVVFDAFNNSDTHASNLHIRHWGFFKRLFNITDMSRYGIEAKGLEPIYKQRYQITGIENKDKLRNIMLCELFLKFRKDGGVVR